VWQEDRAAERLTRALRQVVWVEGAARIGISIRLARLW
jgi:hypothetical protein